MSHLALFLFGPPRMERDGEIINVDTRKATALISYLAITRQRHSRDALAALLWPDYDQPHARATLRRTLSALNKALAGTWLSIDRETVGLDQQASFWLDVDEFQGYLAECRKHNHPASEVCSACIEPLTKVVKLYRDDFMAGFSLHDSSNFDDWQFYQADSLRRDLASALERLVLCHSAYAGFETAITYARRWLTIDRLHEPAHRYLMQLYAWSGQRAAAIHQYQECVQILDEELGVTPLEATVQLYEAIKDNQVPPPPTPTTAPVAVLEDERGTQGQNVATVFTTSPPTAPLAPLQPTSYPLVGRLSEWSTLIKAYTGIGNDGHVVILEGEAGIGKTRLAEEFLEYARNRGARVVAARCYEGETNLAYGPIVAGLRTAIAQREGKRWQEKLSAHWLSEAARLLPELATLRQSLPVTPPLDSPGAQSRFFEGLRQVLIALCSGVNGSAPGIVFIDDVHWADGASFDLFSYLVRRQREQPLCLLLNWRHVQVSNVQRLHHIVSEVQHTGQATILSLSRLSQSTVKTLVQAIEGEPPQGLVERLYSETEGLPLFLTEYLTAITNGTLNKDDDDWSLPGGVRDLLYSRLAAVGEASWQLLSTAATIGRSFDFDTLREASGRSEEETVNALEELVNQGLVTEMSGGEQALMYDFSHEKLRTLVYEETSQARRRLLHRRVAEVLVTRSRGRRETGSQAGQIAYHYQAAGNLVAAAEYYVQAGEYTCTLYANTEALIHFHTALTLGYPDTARLYEAIGDLYTLQGEYSAALKSYEKAAILRDGQMLATIEHKIGNVHERRGEWEQAKHYFEAALRMPGEAGPTDERARIYADWSLAAHHSGQIKQALDLAQQALELAEVANDTHALAQAHNMLGILASSQGDIERAHYHLEHSLALADNLNDPSIRAAALNNLALVYKANGTIERALELTEAALALSTAQGDRHREAALHSNMADLLHDAKRAEDSMIHLKRAVSIYTEIGVEAGAVQPEIWKLAEW